MKKEHLKAMRLIVPGVLIFLLFYPLYKGNFALDGLVNVSTKDAVYLVVVLVAGGIYKTLELRGIMFKERLDEVHENIKHRLLAPFSSDPKIAKLRALPAQKFLKVFYNLIDNDESLKEKSKDVFENGLLWSSYSDVGVISIFGAIIYALTFMITGQRDFAFFALFLVALWGLSIPLIFLSVNKHKKLGDDQLEIITKLHQSRLRELLEKL